MNRLGGCLVIGVLLLSGCASSPGGAAPLAPAAAAASASAADYTEIATLIDALAYARTLDADTPRLAVELNGTTEALLDHLYYAGLPEGVETEMYERLNTVSWEMFQDPTDPESHLSELMLIADEIEESMTISADDFEMDAGN